MDEERHTDRATENLAKAEKKSKTHRMTSREGR